MFALIAAVIAVIGNIIGGALGNQYQTANNVTKDLAIDRDYEHQKTLIAYGLVSKREQQTFAIVLVLSVAVLIVLLAIIFSKKVK